VDWPKSIPCADPARCRVGVCDVCGLVSGDMTEKPTKFCGLCKAWICDECRPAWKDRGVAALKVARGVARPSELPSVELLGPRQLRAEIRMAKRLARPKGAWLRWLFAGSTKRLTRQTNGVQ
jgi:hypothetical protein